MGVLWDNAMKRGATTLEEYQLRIYKYNESKRFVYTPLNPYKKKCIPKSYRLAKLCEFEKPKEAFYTMERLDVDITHRIEVLFGYHHNMHSLNKIFKKEIGYHLIRCPDGTLTFYYE